MSSDGGRDALAGFLYQLGNTIALPFSESLLPTEDDDGIELAICIPEVEGQDAMTVDSGGKVRLVQFKYSRRGRSLTLPALRSIGRKLHSAADAIDSSGNVRIELHTNMPLNGAASTAMEVVAAGSGGSAKVRADLQGLVYEFVDGAAWKSALSDYGSRFGMREAEIEVATAWWVGHVLTLASQTKKHAVQAADFLDRLIGTRAPFVLESTTSRPRARGPAKEFLAEVTGEIPLLPREGLLQELTDACRKSAVVIVEGEGGCGKSVLLAQFIHECCTTADTPVFACAAYADSVDAADTSRRVIRHLVGLTPDPTAGDGRQFVLNENDVVERLAISNPNAERPLFYLGLDAFDEASEEAVTGCRRTFHWFENERRDARRSDRPPVASLIVSCRDADELRDWILPGSPSALPDPDSACPVVRVGPYSDSEVEEVARLNAGSPFAHVAQRRASSSAIGPWGSELQSPILLGILLSLPNDVQELALGGNPSGIRAVGERYASWVTEKAVRRSRGASRVSTNTARAILEYAAVATKPFSTPHAESAWFEACAPHGIGLPEIRVVFQSAVTSGVLTREGKLVRWRHVWFADQLAGDEAITQ